MSWSLGSVGKASGQTSNTEGGTLCTPEVNEASGTGERGGHYLLGQRGTQLKAAGSAGV